MTIEQEAMKCVKRNMAEGWAWDNAVDHMCFESFKEKYGRYPELVEVWDFEKDIIKRAKELCEDARERLVYSNA